MLYWCILYDACLHALSGTAWVLSRCSRYRHVSLTGVSNLGIGVNVSINRCLSVLPLL